MALRDVAAFHAWIERESPSQRAWSTARSFIAKIGDEPWQAPSIPVTELSNQPEYEVREAALEVPGEADVRVYYSHAYASGNVDLIAVTNL
ncbi:MAG: hypothetical protein GY745_14240 [Actinomycetia bacterium]|nr:hypothetical protein [Actinomycetes bacterium]MCP4086194.1 hypothetical protein [Actinomycetes bacterium]